MKNILLVLLITVFTMVAWAVPVEVGSGVNSSYLYIEWSDGFVAEFTIKFGTQETDTISGLEVFDIVEGNTALTTAREDFGWGIFIDGIILGTHSNVGSGPGDDDWWHQWINDPETGDWTWGAGITSRVVSNGDSDGWIYGHSMAPSTTIPEPASIALLGLGGLFLKRKKA